MSAEPQNPDYPNPRGSGTISYLQRREHHHLLLRALDLLQQNGPLGLLVQLVDPDGVVLRTARNGEAVKHHPPPPMLPAQAKTTQLIFFNAHLSIEIDARDTGILRPKRSAARCKRNE